MDTLYSPIAWWYADVSQRYVPDKCNDIYVNLLLRTVHKNVCTLHTAALSKFFFLSSVRHITCIFFYKMWIGLISLNLSLQGVTQSMLYFSDKVNKQTFRWAPKWYKVKY